MNTEVHKKAIPLPRIELRLAAFEYSVLSVTLQGDEVGVSQRRYLIPSILCAKRSDVKTFVLRTKDRQSQ
jgi:hypothetical protein